MHLPKPITQAKTQSTSQLNTNPKTQTKTKQLPSPHLNLPKRRNTKHIPTQHKPQSKTKNKRTPSPTPHILYPPYTFNPFPNPPAKSTSPKPMSQAKQNNLTKIQSTNQNTKHLQTQHKVPKQKKKTKQPTLPPTSQHTIPKPKAPKQILPSTIL